MSRRRKHRDKNAASGKRKGVLLAGAALLMLAATLLLIVPLSRQKNISWKHALLLAFGLWLVSLLLGGICLRSTRRKRKRRHSSRSTSPASLNDGESIDPPPTGTAAEGPN